MAALHRSFESVFTVVFQICDRDPAHFPDRMQEDLVSPGEKPSSSVLSEVGRGEGCIRGWRVYSVRVTRAVHCNSLTPWSSTEKSKQFWIFWILPDTLLDLLIVLGFTPYRQYSSHVIAALFWCYGDMNNMYIQTQLKLISEWLLKLH